MLTNGRFRRLEEHSPGGGGGRGVQVKVQPHAAILHTCDGVFQSYCDADACIVLRCIFQHVGIFAADFGISQAFIIRFSNGFQRVCSIAMFFP